MKCGQLYKGICEDVDIEVSRVWSMPTPWTFEMTAVKAILDKYVGDGKGWIDPFAGENSPAEFRNDHNPLRQAEYHLEARDFVAQMEGPFEGILFDPPYSFTQVKEHYQTVGQKPTKEFTDMRFYEKVKSLACEKIKTGGYAISFGWNSNGFGKARGFRVVELMLIAHGGSKNDTIVTVEIKL